ncbi:MAG: hypothetical protein M1829_004859 [Trizodia sp. TS-e1964]|nr:MAG: hypothetical protein M1829_004859 [Trizodia sp. TS-e1964]
MDYLISEGYPGAARNFAQEAQLKPSTGIESIQERLVIRNAIHSGDIQSAILNINELNPQILEQNSGLHFALLRLQLIELVRGCMSDPQSDITSALNFATAHLAPKAPLNPEFLEDLEKTLALLIFPADSLTAPLAELLDPALRKSVAIQVNEAILSYEGARKEARLRMLIQLRAWSETHAREGKRSIPANLELGLGLNTNRESAHHLHHLLNGDDDGLVS